MMTNDYNKKANRVLGIVFGLFVAAALLKYHYPHKLLVKMIFMMAEAALVGGIADWFAVTALFRRPLGFPWHTGLIPRNRGKIIEAIARTVQNELLSKESLKRRLAGVRLVDFVIMWLDSWNRQELVKITAGYAGNILAGIEPARVAKVAQKMLKAYLQTTTLAPSVRQGLEWALASGKAEQFLDYVLVELQAVVRRESTRQTLYEYLERYKQNVSQTWWQRFVLDIAEMTNTLNLNDAATVLHGELLQFIEDLSDSGHPVRCWIHDRLALAAVSLETDQAWVASIHSWQQGVARRLDLEEALTTLAELALSGSTQPAIWIAAQAEKLLDTFRADPVLQDWTEDRLKAALGQFIDVEHNLVATVVKEALERLSDRDLNRFIEDKAGEDLAWIRINGSVVGGLVGLILFLFLQYVYDPVLMPLVQTGLQ